MMKASGWKRRIMAACKTAGTYGEQYTAVIDTLAAILEKRDDAEAQYQESGSLPIIEHTNKGGATNLTKNPALTLWDSLNHSALEHWRELGLTPSSYKKIRGVANYGKVRQNIITYDAWRKKHSSNTSLGIQMVVVNACDVEKFYSANADLPVDYISFRPVESKQGEFYSEKQAMEQYLSIVETLNNLSISDSRVKLNYKWNFIQPENKLSKCAANWAQMAINEKGQVMYCCNKPTEIVGHIMDDDILDKKARYNTNMELCRIPCRLTGPNEALKHILRDKDSSCFI